MVKHLPAMRETWVRFLGREDLLEKEMAIHYSTLAWEIPWMEEPDRLQSMGSQSRRTPLSERLRFLSFPFIVYTAIKFDRFSKQFSVHTILQQYMLELFRFQWYLTNSISQCSQMFEGKVNVYCCTLRKHVYKQGDICSGKTYLLLSSTANTVMIYPY